MENIVFSMPTRDENGQFEPTASEADVLAAVRKHDPAATSEVGDAVDLKRHSADYRLRKLREAGAVCSKKIGPSLVWYIPRKNVDSLGDLEGDEMTETPDMDDGLPSDAVNETIVDD
jgi:predicted ArsR family transcriptional regulator